MDCKVIEGALVAFQFGVLGGDEGGAAPATGADEPVGRGAAVGRVDRDAVEEHLAGCAGCLRAFFALKRAVELDGGGPRPSQAARERLRSAVVVEFGPGRRAARAAAGLRFGRGRRLLVGGAAALLLVAALASVRGLVSHRTEGRDLPRAVEGSGARAVEVDSARAEPASLHVL